jgi:hypothetical protein
MSSQNDCGQVTGKPQPHPYFLALNQGLIMFFVEYTKLLRDLTIYFGGKLFERKSHQHDS